jgi:hypothetical protein
MAYAALPRPIDRYFEAERFDRLQGWWQVSRVQERIRDTGIEALRPEALDRFRLHIERWLDTSRKRVFDGEPFPRLAARVAGVASPPATSVEESAAAFDAPAPWPVETVANG